MFVYFVSIANGLLNTVNKMVNVRAGQCLGKARGSLVNYAEASIISLCLIFVLGNGGELSWEHISQVPLVFYLGSFCGLAAMVLIMLGTTQTGAMLSTILMLAGQLGTATVLDYVFFGTCSWQKILGLFLVIAGIAWREKIQHESV